MKVNKNKFLSNIIVASLLSAPTILFAAVSTTNFTINATVTPNFGVMCGSSDPTACSLSSYNFGSNAASYYQTAHSIYYKATIGTNQAQGSGTGVYYKITDSTASATVSCNDGTDNNCFQMKGQNTSSLLPFQVAYQACTTSTPLVFSPGSIPVPVPLNQSSISGPSGACTDIPSTSGTPIVGTPPTGVNYGALMVTIPAQTVSSPTPDIYSDTVTVTVCGATDSTCAG